MQYQVISADGHIDLPWLPPDLFTNNASKEFKDRVPYVTDNDKGPIWVANNGIQFGHLPAKTQAKIVCGNAARLYGFFDNKVN